MGLPPHSFHSDSADLTWSSDSLPFSATYQDVYHSAQDAAGESANVFLAGNQLENRWRLPHSGQESFVIAELGFGAALNFMLTWQLWRQCERHESWKTLYYVAYERFPLSVQQLNRVHGMWPDLGELSHALLTEYQPDCTGSHRHKLGEDVVLDLIIGDACSELELRHEQDRKVDAWFLDGFSPHRNPELWSGKLFQLLATHSHEHTTLATYSSAGEVRRGLSRVGFNVTKAAGFGSKRHMLLASGLSIETSPAQTESTRRQKPWFQLPPSPSHKNKALIIGAGLAGCHTANALARRGWQVKVLESNDNLQQGISGIPQLALRCRLFRQADPQARLFLESFIYASSLLRTLQIQEDCGWHETGLLQFFDALNKRNPLDGESTERLYPESIVCVESSYSLCGETEARSGLWFKHGGWVDAKKLYSRLLAHPQIDLSMGCCVSGIRQQDGCWEVLAGDSVVDTAEVVVLACGAGVRNFVQTSSLPLELSQGRCTLVESQPPFDQLEVVACGSRTLFPPLNGVQTIAASYGRPDHGISATDEDRENLQGLADFLTHSCTMPRVTGSAGGTRVNTRDRLPMIGPVADLDAMAEQYAELSRNAGSSLQAAGKYLPGLYLSVGHGSNGLATCSHGGEYLASLINGDSLPINRESIDALNPCRFLIQDLKKQRLV